MSEQAIYDAVRSRISNGDIGQAVDAAVRDCNLSHYADMAAEAIRLAASFYESPSAVYRPKLFIDGNEWCALYSENIQDGVAGFGISPALAMANFDSNWVCELRASK